jgi:hypothetical protein
VIVGDLGNCFLILNLLITRRLVIIMLTVRSVLPGISENDIIRLINIALMREVTMLPTKKIVVPIIRLTEKRLPVMQESVMLVRNRSVYDALANSKGPQVSHPGGLFYASVCALFSSSTMPVWSLLAHTR